jgi:hypothetical protein
MRKSHKQKVASRKLKKSIPIDLVKFWVDRFDREIFNTLSFDTEYQGNWNNPENIFTIDKLYDSIELMKEMARPFNLPYTPYLPYFEVESKNNKFTYWFDTFKVLKGEDCGKIY